MSLINVFTLDLDLKNPNFISEPNVTSSDTVRFVVNLTDGGLAYDITTATLLTLATTRPDTQVIIKSGTRTGTNQVTFDFGAPSTAVPGRANAKIQIYDAAGRISVISFTYMVTADPSGTNYTPTSYDQTLIQEVLGEGPAILAAAETATTNANNAATEAVSIANDASDEAITIANNAASGATSVANTAAANAVTIANNAAATTQMTWKAPVTNFADIATTYPTPSNGWSVRVVSTGDRYRYNSSNATWEKVDTMDTDGMANSSELDTMDTIRADLFRQQYLSGVFDYSSIIKNGLGNVGGNLGAVVVPSASVGGFSGNENKFWMEAFAALINGYKSKIQTGSVGSFGIAQLDLDPPPTIGKRDDLLFLEGWFPQGGDRGVMFTRLRKVAGVDFTKFPQGLSGEDGTYLSDFGNQCYPQGGNASPLTTHLFTAASDQKSSFMNNKLRTAVSNVGRHVFLGDGGLWVAGEGDQTSKDALKTADGYVYAIPLFKVERRNNGGYRKDNLNGARDYVSHSITTNITSLNNGSTGTVTFDSTAGWKAGDTIVHSTLSQFNFLIQSVDSSTQVTVLNTGNSTSGTFVMYNKSDRPDGLYSNIIDAEDITDLRHHIPINVNYQKEAEQTFDQILQGTLRTKDTKTLQKDVWGLRPAPYGLVQELQPTRIQRPDGTFVDLVNLFGSLSSWEKNTIAYATGDNFDSEPTGIRTIGYVGVDETQKYVFVKETSDIHVLYYYDASHGFINYSGEIFQKYSKITLPAGTSYVRISLRLVSSSGDAVSVPYNKTLPRFLNVLQSEYDLIDVNADWTGGDKIAALYPYTESYPNFVENLLSGTPDLLHASAKMISLYELTLTTSDVFQASYFDFMVSEVGTYTMSIESFTTGGRWFFRCFDVSNTILLEYASDTTLIKTFIAPSETIKIRLYLDNIIAGTFTFSNWKLEKGSSNNPFVPYGRHFLDKDYLANDHLQIPSTYHYEGVNGGKFTYGRRTFSDAVSHDEVTEIVESLNTPQKHIKVTQATAGEWAIGDTIDVVNYDGVVTGVIDSDTAIARIIGWVDVNNILVDDVSKLSVNDTVAFINNDGTMSATLFTTTITAINTTTKQITVDQAFASSWGNGFLVETTASSSAPSVTCTGIAGTWTNLGTHKATYTLTTAPTTNTDSIKIAYSIVCPAGKGYDYVPTDILKAEVNGRELLVANTVSVKANFVGKVSGNTDANANKAYRDGTHTSLLAPGSFTVELVTTDSSLGYNVLSNLDGTTVVQTNNGSGWISQHLLSFNLIRAIEDVYGEQFFSDCLTDAEKVIKLKTSTVLHNFVFDWWGYGSGPSGNHATISVWIAVSNTWANIPGVWEHSDNIARLLDVQALSETAIANMIDDNGFCHFLAHAEASDGTTASTIFTDYAELSVILVVAETGYTALQPTDPFPKLPENLMHSREAIINDLGAFTFSNFSTKMSLTLEDGGYVNKGYLKVASTVSSGDTAWYLEPVNLRPVNSGELYTFSWYQKNNVSLTNLGTSDNYTTSIIFFNSSGSEISRVKLTNMGDVNESWHRVSMSAIAPSGSVTASTRIGMDVPDLTTGQYVALDGFKFQKGTLTDWTPGRNSLKTLNFLGKIAGSESENPHRHGYAAKTTFDSPISGNYNLGQSNVSQTDYDNIGRQDGVLRNVTNSSSGYYSAQLFEFDLSHLGLSLSELKDKIRTVVITWVGYGSGSNSGSLTNGATGKVWNDTIGAWADTSIVGTSGTPETKTDTTTVSAAKYLITTDQKIYVLVYSTYASDGTIGSNIYTDYIKLDITLSEQVDFVKANIVKIRPETKEIKLAYPAKSYRYIGAEDQVALWTRYVPYQGYATGLVSNVEILTEPKRILATTLGTGGTIGSEVGYRIYSNMTERLPSSNPSSIFVPSVIASIPTVYAPLTPLMTWRDIIGSGYNYVSPLLMSIVGKKANFGNLSVKTLRGYQDSNTQPTIIMENGANGLYFPAAPELEYAVDHMNVIFMLVSLSSNEIVLAVTTAKYSNPKEVSGGGAWDIYHLPGRPLVKGVG